MATNVNNELVFVFSCLNRYSRFLHKQMMENATIIRDLSAIETSKINDVELRKVSKKYTTNVEKDFSVLLIDNETFTKNIVLLQANTDAISYSKYKFHNYVSQIDKMSTAFQKQTDLVTIKCEIADRMEKLDANVGWTLLLKLIKKERDFIKALSTRLHAITD